MKKSLFQSLFYALTLLLGVALFGCLNYEQSIKLNADGSGSMKIHYWTKESNIMSITKLSFDEKEIRESQYKPELIKNVKVESNQADSTKHVYVELDFKDINKLDQTKGFKDNLIKFEPKGGFMVFTHTIKKDSNANNMGMDAYTLKYDVEFSAKPENVDPVGKVEGNFVKWEYKYSELGNRDIVMTASIKGAATGMSSGVIIGIVVVVLIIIVIVVMMSKKKPAPTPPPAA